MPTKYAYPLVQAKSVLNQNSGGGAITPSLNETTVSGNFLLVYIGMRQGAAASASFTVSYNSVSLTQTANGMATAGANGYSGSLYYLENITGSASPQFTITPSGESVDYDVFLAEFSGVNTSSPLDVNTFTNNAFSAALTAGPTSGLAQNVELAVFGYRQGTTAGVTAFGVNGWYPAGNEAITLGAAGLFYRMTAGPAAVTANGSFPTSFSYSVSIACFKATAEATKTLGDFSGKPPMVNPLRTR